LPAPLGPRRPIRSPAHKVKLISSKRGFDPNDLDKEWAVSKDDIQVVYPIKNWKTRGFAFLKSYMLNRFYEKTEYCSWILQ
jgi:hypothetical protein